MTEIQNARRQEIRNKILNLLDDQRPLAVGQSVLLRALASNNCTLQELKAELAYLAEKGLISNEGNANQWLATLNHYGVDLLEGSQEAPVGLGQVFVEVNQHEYLRRQEIRWRILRVADIGRPMPVSESLMWRALDDAALLLTAKELRREILYLQDKKLLRFEVNPRDKGSIELTADGVDVVEYSAPAPVGVERPPNYSEE